MENNKINSKIHSKINITLFIWKLVCILCKLAALIIFFCYFTISEKSFPTFTTSIPGPLAYPHTFCASLSDRNECLTRQSPCTQSEDCVNTIGGYICQRRISRLVPHRHRANRIGNAPRRMRDDPYSRAGEYREASQANTEFGCPMGWLFQHGHCVGKII